MVLQVLVVSSVVAVSVDYVITHKAERCKGCRYVIVCNPQGGTLNDPILLRPHVNEGGFSLADPDMSR